MRLLDRLRGNRPVEPDIEIVSDEEMLSAIDIAVRSTGLSEEELERRARSGALDDYNARVAWDMVRAGQRIKPVDA